MSGYQWERVSGLGTGSLSSSPLSTETPKWLRPVLALSLLPTLWFQNWTLYLHFSLVLSSPIHLPKIWSHGVNRFDPEKEWEQITFETDISEISKADIFCIKQLLSEYTYMKIFSMNVVRNPKQRSVW